MNKKFFSFVIFLLLITFAVVSAGGCGGSNGAISSNNSGSDVAVIDIDENGIPNILYFDDDIEEISYENDELIQNKKISIPSRHYLANFKDTAESPDSFVADLTAGIEYTVEFSKGESYEYPIGNSIPDVEIINPQGNSLSFFDFDKSKELKIKSEGKKNDSIKEVIISLRQLQGLVNNVGFDDHVNIDLNDDNILIGNATNAIERLRVYVNTLLNQQNQISENMLRDAGNNSSIAQVPDLFHPPVQLPIGP